MTKRKAVAFIFILAIVILISAFGITSARYSSTVEVNQTIEYAKIIGKLSLYNPQNVESFPEGETCYDASEGCFRICASKPGCDNIKFSISNTVTKDEVKYTNGVITDCFVRIMPATPEGTVPVDYLVYKEDRIADVDDTPTVDDADKYELTDVGGTDYYGGADFALSTDKKDPFVFSMQVSWKKKTVKDENGNDAVVLDSATLGTHSCKVQLVRKKIELQENDSDDTYYVLDEVLLKLRFDVEIDYYEMGGGEDGSPKLAASKLKVFDVGDAVDFKKDMPAGYIFKRATSCAWGWADASDGVIEITNDLAQYPVQVVCLKEGVVTVTVDYRERSSPKEYGEEGGKYVVFDLVREDVLQIDKSKVTTIDFKNPNTLAAVGIALPDIAYETAAADGTKTNIAYRS